jgi:hypothetical protein
LPIAHFVVGWLHTSLRVEASDRLSSRPAQSLLSKTPSKRDRDDVNDMIRCVAGNDMIAIATQLLNAGLAIKPPEGKV